MIWITALLAAGLIVSPVLLTLLHHRHQRRQMDQNQLLTAALMATKNSPYAAIASHQLDNSDVDPQDLVQVVPTEPDPIIPTGTKLLGT